MGVYIHIINRTKKEYLCSGCTDNGLKLWGYRLGHCSKLLTYLLTGYWNLDPKDLKSVQDIQTSYKNRFNPYIHRFDGDLGPPTDKREYFSFSGHWVGDEVGIVSDHGAICDEGDYEYVCGQEPNQSQPSEYQNVTIPVVLEWNSEFDYPEGEKDKIKPRPCSYHHDLTSWVFYERVNGSICEHQLRWMGEHGDEDARMTIERADKDWERRFREANQHLFGPPKS